MNQVSKLSSDRIQYLIRCPKETDFAGMAELAGQLGYPCTASEIRARLSQMGDSTQYAIYVAEVPECHVAGWLGAHVFRAVELNKCAEISGLVVAHQFRSRGIGRALLDAAEQWARTLGCEVISVSSNVTRTRAHRFYLSNGYQWNKTQESFRKNL